MFVFGDDPFQVLFTATRAVSIVSNCLDSVSGGTYSGEILNPGNEGASVTTVHAVYRLVRAVGFKLGHDPM